MRVIRKIKELRAEIARAKEKSRVVALVPTMGALHDGHLSLVEIAKRKADLAVVSIFVNPTQFGPNDDFSRYPRVEKEDLEKLKGRADIVFIPKAEEIYPPGFSSSIDIGEIGKILEGEFRPGHFNGVAMVVAKLFGLVQPDMAIFGEKDYQQLQVIKKLVRDFNMPVEILSGKTMREKDGLALSSRNRYLTEKERQVAPWLYAEMKECARKIKAGIDVGKTISLAKKNLLNAGFSKIDYIEPVDANIMPGKSRLLAAAWLGKTRLIDNISL